MIKQQGSEIDHSPPAGAVMKNMWIYISAPTEAFMV
jgi:hypothetical protein